MEIHKFGGAALSSREGFQKLSEILSQDSKEKKIVVISALSKSTQNLSKAAVMAEQRKKEEARRLIKFVIEEHHKFIREIIFDTYYVEKASNEINDLSKRLYDLIEGLLITGYLTNKTLDKIISFGEVLALSLISNFLKDKKISHYAESAVEFMATDDEHGKARPLEKYIAKSIKEKVIQKLENEAVYLTQGFIGRNLKGDVTTMGYESSNLTAALLAKYSDADRIVFWTNVPGIRTADPEYVSGHKLMKYLNYDDAEILALSGLKLIYPGMIKHCREKNIELIYRSAFSPKGSTSIKNENITTPLPVILLIKGLNDISGENTDNAFMHFAGPAFNKILYENNPPAINENGYKAAIIIINNNRKNLFYKYISDNCEKDSYIIYGDSGRDILIIPSENANDHLRGLHNALFEK